MGEIERRALKVLGKKRDELNKSDLGRIAQLSRGPASLGADVAKKADVKIIKRLNGFVVENHALKLIGVEKGELDRRHKRDIQKLDVKELKEETGMDEETVSELLPRAKKNLSDNIQENLFFKLIQVDRREASPEIERIDLLMYLVTPKHWMKRYKQELSDRELAVIKKRVNMIVYDRTSGR